jgi:hypothetical protein
MLARLIYRDSQGREGAVDLDEGIVCHIGRALECGVRTDDALVSRRHSRIWVEGGHFVIEDLGSANGTYVNDLRMAKQVLRHNDVVRCGSLWLRFLEDAPLGRVVPPLAPIRPPRPLDDHGDLRETAEESGTAALGRPPLRTARGTATPDALPIAQAVPALRPPGGATVAGFADDRDELIRELRGEVAALTAEVVELRRTITVRDEAARANLKVIAELRRQMVRRRDATDTREEGTVTRVHPVEPHLLGAARRSDDDDLVGREPTDVVAAIGVSPASAPTVDR